MGFWNSLFGRSKRLPERWRKGEPNPIAPNARVDPWTVGFDCPVCSGRTSIALADIKEPKRGVLWPCDTKGCKNVFHIPPSFCGRSAMTNDPVVAGVAVLIPEFNEWYLGHPVYEGLGEEDWLLEKHGLWAFCAGCHHRILATVLTSFAAYQTMRKVTTAPYAFAARSDESAADMESLQNGRCSECASDTLICLMVNIPNDIRARLSDQE